MLRCAVILLFVLFSSVCGHAGNDPVADSLRKVIASESAHDTTRVAARYQLGERLPILRPGYWDSLRIDCATKALATDNETVRKTFRHYQAFSFNNLGYCYKEQGDFQKGIEYYNSAWGLFSGLNDSAGMANVNNNLGLVYYNLGDIEVALTHYENAVLMREALADHQGMGNTYNNLGLLYHSQHDTVRALEFYRKSIYERALVGDHKGVAQGLNNIGVIQDDYGNYDSAFYYYRLSLNMCREHNNNKGAFTALSNLANILKVHGKPDTALILYRESLSLRRQYGSKSHVSKCMSSLANVFLVLGNTDSALYYGLNSLELAKQLNYPENISDAAEALTAVYEKLGDGTKALEMYRLYIASRDRISNEASQQATAKQQAQYAYEKQKILDDAAHANELAVEEEKQAKQRAIIIAAIAGLILVAAFLLFVFNRLRITRRQKQIIEEQKVTVELAHAQLEDKNNSILDSISYARIIQNAILPSEKAIAQLLPHHFILYKPKDIVAGDFYWLEKRGETLLFAVADCTGHGVPGALTSVFCNNALNRSAREFGHTDPARLLESARQIILEEFGKNEDEVYDGMDISLCALTGRQLLWAGANNGLWIVRNGQLIEYKPDKQPISIYEESKPFTTHAIALEPGDQLYLYSDGYADQFGGERGKKFKASRMKELIVSISTRSMADQKAILDATLESWRGDIEQIDDICIWGVRIS